QTRWLTSRIAQLEPLVEKKEYEKVRAELQVVAEAFLELGRKHPGESKMRAFQAYAYKRLGAVEGVLGNYEVGIEWYQRAMELHRLAKERLGESTCEVDIAWALQRMGKLREANEAMDRALEIRRELAVGRGKDQQSKLSLVSAIFRKAILLEEEKRWLETVMLLEEAAALMKPLEGDAMQNRLIGETIHQVELMRGNALWESGRRAESRAAYKRGLSMDGGRAVQEARVALARQRLRQTESSAPASPSR
ncbi:MAG: tetratricopeptide repeat protein, partial [Bryobacteraceae bacterium]|nr:tetratricopeptide repeat protein [Bryobacteraceae bacterium]